MGICFSLWAYYECSLFSKKYKVYKVYIHQIYTYRSMYISTYVCITNTHIEKGRRYKVYVCVHFSQYKQRRMIIKFGSTSLEK